MDHYVAYMESEIRALRLERDLLQARTAQQAAEVERLKAGCGILPNTTLNGTTLLGRVAELEAEVNDLRAQLSKTKADREHYRVLWEDEHCPTCYGPCAGCDDV